LAAAFERAADLQCAEMAVLYAEWETNKGRGDRA
jgi:hypothetical protein